MLPGSQAPCSQVSEVQDGFSPGLYSVSFLLGVDVFLHILFYCRRVENHRQVRGTQERERWDVNSKKIPWW